MNDRARQRLYVADGLAEGAVLTLDEAQSHYLLNVLRARAGSAVLVFNGRDGEWRAVLAEAGKRRAVLSVAQSSRVQADSPDLWLLFAPVKRTRIDFIVEKATELGVSRLMPVETERTIVERVNQARLTAIATEAAEQCGRLDVPTVSPARRLTAALAEWPAERRLLMLDESGGGRPLAEVLLAATPGPFALLTGPEGGFAKSELDGLKRLAFASPVGLGPRILRADTAALAALACFQAILGDWRQTSPITG
jgi:16S rRNA (uracil1498-N3)-methyltransferase